MTSVCYITKGSSRLTLDPEEATSVRFMQGERELVLIEEDSQVNRKEKKLIHQHKRSCYTTLSELILENLGSGARKGWYLLSGRRVDTKFGGYCIGGAPIGGFPAHAFLIPVVEFIAYEEVETILGLLENEISYHENENDGGISFWLTAGFILFDTFTWVSDLNVAKEIAFQERDEFAIWDVENNAELLDMTKLKISDDHGYSFGRFLKHAHELRKAKGLDKMRLLQRIYVDAVFPPLACTFGSGK